MAHSRWFRVVVLAAAVLAVVGAAVLCLPKVAYRIALFVQTGGTYDPIMVNPRHAFTPIPVANSTRTLRGHHGSVVALAFFPDGTHLVSGGDDHTIRIWDLSSGACRVVEGHDGTVNALAVSNDGTRLISAGADLIARVWNLKDGKMIAQLEGHTAAITGVGFVSRDRVITSSNDGTLRLWDVNDEQQVAEWDVQETGVRSLSISKDGTRAALIAGDGTACLWDVTRGACVWSLPPPREDPQDGRRGDVPMAPPAVALSGDARRLFALEPDAQLQSWDVATRQAKDGLDASLRIQRISLSADGAFLLTVTGGMANVYSTSSTDHALFQSTVIGASGPPDGVKELAEQAAAGKPPTEAMVKNLAGDMFRQALNMPVACSAALSPDGSRAAVGLGAPDLGRLSRGNTDKSKPASIVVFDRPR